MPAPIHDDFDFAEEPDLNVGVLRPVLAIGALVALVLLLVSQVAIRRGEACASAELVRSLSPLNAQCIGTSVQFVARGQLTGYSLSLGCTAAFLTIPFFVLTALLLVVRRASIAFATVALAVSVVTIFAVNQLRLLLVGAGMGFWGGAVGYSRTHLLLGTIVSTLGVIGAGRLYLALVIRGPRAVLSRG